MPRKSSSSKRRAPRETATGSPESPAGRRLQVVLAEAGVGSRRACEELIEAGRVRVNGETVTRLPVFVEPAKDAIELDGEPFVIKGRTGSKRRFRYLAVHKPRHVISTTRDPEGRRSVVDLVEIKGGQLPRLFPVGRLDAESTGLILLTNDGDLAEHLTHPRYGVPKRYLVSVRGVLGDEDMQRLRDGLYLADRRRGAGAHKARAESVRKLGVEKDRARGDRTRLSITLREGRNREIRRMLARLGFKVRRLKRVAIGPLELKGVPVGGWRDLTASEVRQLRDAARAAEADAKRGDAENKTPAARRPSPPRSRRRRDAGE